jgi:outer membrane receptor protein involved in Fe transport
MEVYPVNKLILFVTLIILTSLSALLLAGTTGKIAGYVRDSSTGEPLPGANVLIEGTFMGAAADREGYYYINNVPPGFYRVSTQMMGYSRLMVEKVRVSIDLTTELNFRLKQEAISVGEEVVVTAERPLVQKDLTSTSVVVSSEEIQAIPVESFTEVVNLQAGVVDGHFRGGRRGEVAYLVDGLSVTDAFNGAVAVEIENTSIREMEVISGTFNAEYGQAMSGIVNIVTKDGSSKLEGSFSGYAGNYITSHDDIFEHADQLNGAGFQNLQATVSGPVPLPLLKDMTLFLTGRYFKDDGQIFGTRVYNITDANPFAPSGDRKYVPMNDYRKYSLQAKLTYYPTRSLKISYSGMWDDNKNHYYDHLFRWTPDGIQTHFRRDWLHNVILTHGVSQSFFHTLKLSMNRSDYEGFVFEDPFDPRHVNPDQGLPLSGYTFRSGGIQRDRYDRYTHTTIAQWSMQNQFNKEHRVGAGVEFRHHEIFNHWREIRNLSEGLIDDQGNQIFTLGYAAEGTAFNQRYTKRPMELAAYLQDKFEYKGFIFNAGLRFDYFDPNSSMPSDVKNPEGNPNFPSGFEDASVKYQLSPRLGCSFPISEQGAIHFSYGHFFQIPRFENLYQNSQNWAIARGRGLSTILGNPDLEPERTVMYEVGLQQVIFPNVVLDVTGYFRDIRNLLGTEIIETYDKEKYARFINRDYANVRGFIVSLEKRYSNYFRASIDYTYQIAEGNASDPRAVFQDNQTDPPVESEKKVVPLDWDQRSTLNAEIVVGNLRDWSIGVIGHYGSGMPYTRDFQRSNDVRFENNGRKPATHSVDLRVEKKFDVLRTRISTFLLVYNVFDRKNELGVYPTTGRATYDLNVRFAGDIIGLNDFDDFINNPQLYSTPREVRLGMSFEF